MSVQMIVVYAIGILLAVYLASRIYRALTKKGKRGGCPGCCSGGKTCCCGDTAGKKDEKECCKE